MTSPDEPAVQLLAEALARHRVNTYRRAILGRTVVVREDQSPLPLPTGDEISIARGLLADLREMEIRPAPASSVTACPACRSPRWVAVSFDEGTTRRRQCVPCGAVWPGVILG